MNNKNEHGFDLLTLMVRCDAYCAQCLRFRNSIYSFRFVTFCYDTFGVRNLVDCNACGSHTLTDRSIVCGGTEGIITNSES